MKISASRRLTGEELSLLPIVNLTFAKVDYDLYEPTQDGAIHQALMRLYMSKTVSPHVGVAYIDYRDLNDLAKIAKSILDEKDTKVRHYKIISLMPPKDVSTVLAKDNRAKYYRELGGFVKFVREFDDPHASLYLRH